MMMVTDRGVKDIIEVFSFEFEDDLIEHDLILFIDLYILGNQNWVTIVLLLFQHYVYLMLAKILTLISFAIWLESFGKY